MAHEVEKQKPGRTVIQAAKHLLVTRQNAVFWVRVEKKYCCIISLLAKASGIDRTFPSLHRRPDVDISWLFLYRYGAGHAEWSGDHSHSEP
jgi:hypothetical protein